MAVKHGHKPLFIQVKTNRTAGALKQLAEAPNLDRETMNIQVWIRHDRQGWRIKKLEPETGWTETLDERRFEESNIGEKAVQHLRDG